MRLNTGAIAVTLALAVGAGLFIGTWWAIIWDGISYEMVFLGHYFRGYSISPMGSVVGLLWGLGTGYLGGVIVALLYNKLAGYRETT